MRLQTIQHMKFYVQKLNAQKKLVFSIEKKHTVNEAVLFDPCTDLVSEKCSDENVLNPCDDIRVELCLLRCASKSSVDNGISS